MSTDEERARAILFDLVANKQDWSLPEPQATFSIETAVAACLAFAAEQRGWRPDREAIALTIANFDAERNDFPVVATADEFRFDSDRDHYLRMADAILALPQPPTGVQP